MKKRVRIGVRMPIFVNAGIVVIYVEPEQAEKLERSVATIKGVLTMAGKSGWADRFVCQVQ